MLAIRDNKDLVTGFNYDYFDKFINFIDAKDSTVKAYTRNIKQFMYYIKDNNIKNPTRQDIINYREQLKDRGLKANTIQNYITSLKVFFTWLEQEDLYKNIAQHVKGAKVSKEHKKDYLTANQVKQVLRGIDTNSVQGKRDYAMLSLMFTGGLRTIEVVRANIEDIKTIANNVVLFIQGKGRDEKADYIKLADEVQEAIRVYLQTRDIKTDNEPLFTSTSNNNKGERLTTRSIRSIVKTAFINAGYKSDRLTAHSTRHTAVTLALLNNNNIQEVKQFARHKNIETTLIYAHNIEKINNTCSNDIAKSIF